MPAPYPNPDRGVFETMLVLGGDPVELDAHLERLRASLDLLYDLDLPAATRASILARARGIDHGRLRATATPARDRRLETAISTAEIESSAVFPSWQQGVTLRSVVVAGGLGAHKWADRDLLERAEMEASAIPLLLDSDGAVLEAAKGNLFVVDGGALSTPPTDGRILPGVTRRRAIEVALEEGIEVREEELTLDDLTRAEEVFLTGSVGGVEPVRSVDGMELPYGGGISARIAAGLRHRWLATPEREGAPALAAAPPPGLPAR